MFLGFDKLAIANILLGLFFILMYFVFRKWKPEKRQPTDILMLFCGVGIIIMTMIIQFAFT